MPEVIPSNPTITPGSLPNLAGAGSLMPGAGVEVQTAPGVPTPGTITPVTPETPGMFPGAAPDVHPSTPGLFPGDPPSGTPEAPEPPPSGDPYALKSRKVTGGGLATGGGDLSGDRVITVTEASQAQAEAGTAANVVVTPRRMKQSMEAWLAGLTAADVGADVAGAAATAQAYAVQRANHTGTQSADTVVDGATNKAFTAAEKSKLAGIATGATVANATNIGGAIAGVTTKATPVDADSLWITDSAAGNAAKRLTFASLKTWVTGVINTWWGTVTTAVKTTGNQSISGLKTHATSPRSTGNADDNTSLITKAQGSALMMAGFTPMRKVTGTHSNLTGSVLTFDLSAPSPNWNGPLGSEHYWRTLELIISAQHSGSASGQFILYRAMIFFREYGGTWYLLGQQVIVNSNNANSALGAWQVGPYTPNPGSPSGTIALTNASPGSEHICMLQYAYSYY